MTVGSWWTPPHYDCPSGRKLNDSAKDYLNQKTPLHPANPVLYPKMFHVKFLYSYSIMYLQIYQYIHFVLPICTCICHKLYRYIYMSQIIKVNCNIILTFFYIFYKHMYDQKYWKMYYLLHYRYNGFHLLVLFYIFFFFYKLYHILYFLASIHVFIECIS